MEARRVLAGLLFAAACGVSSAQRFEVADVEGMRWFRGNTHAHSKRSVAQAEPLDVALWYKNHGYQFLVLTDDSAPNDPKTLESINDATFISIPGLELKAETAAQEWIHTNGLNAQSPLSPLTGNSVRETLQLNIDAHRGIHAVPQINHPKFHSGPDREAILASRDCSLFELYNGYVGPAIPWDGAFSSPEKDWDYFLTAGKRIFAVAADDANTYPGVRGGYGGLPGRGWVVVRAKALDGQEICENLEKGLFYASTGVELRDVRIEAGRMTVEIAAKAGLAYKTVFIGRNGTVLSATEANPAVYDLVEDVGYVRARVMDSLGKVAWVQPAFVRAGP